jgi:hypothetical protein
MEAARTSETLVNFYQTTRRYSPEDSHLRTHRLENLKSYLVFSLTTHIFSLGAFQKLTTNFFAHVQTDSQNASERHVRLFSVLETIHQIPF